MSNLLSARGIESGYSGDVWDVQPAPRDHPWRTMKNPLGGGNGMVAHFSGTTLDAQARYAAGAKDILGRWLQNKEQDPQNVIVTNGGYATKACKSHHRIQASPEANLVWWGRWSTQVGRTCLSSTMYNSRVSELLVECHDTTRYI